MGAAANARRCVRCNALLAGDNKAGICWPCQRAALWCPDPPDVPREFWDDEGLRDALLRERHIGHAVRRYRSHPYHGPRKISQTAAANWFNISQPQLQRIETGRRVDDLGRLIQWAKVLRIPQDLLWFTLPDEAAEKFPPPYVQDQSQDRSDSRAAAGQLVGITARELAGKEKYAAVAPQHTAILAEEGDVERRKLLRIFGGMAAAPLIAGIDRPRRELENSINSAATDADADEWERTALRYASEVGRVPLMQVIPDLLMDLDEAQRRLAGSRDIFRIRMTRACGQLSALTAIAFLNIGEFRIANRYWRTAIRAVDETNDRDLQSLIRGRRAVFALYDDKTPPSSILALAKDAIDVADGTPCAGVASGYAARAQALALIGQHDESRHAVQELADIFEGLPLVTAIDRISQWGWSEQRLRHVESHVYSHAGRFIDAATAQDAALALYPKDGYQGRTQVELYKSICIIRGGDPTEGTRHAIRTIQSLPPSVQNDAVVRRTATLMLDVIPESAANLSAVLEARDFLALPELSS